MQHSKSFKNDVRKGMFFSKYYIRTIDIKLKMEYRMIKYHNKGWSI